MLRLLTCGADGEFEHIVPKAKHCQSPVVLLVRDMDAERPLDEKLDAILGETGGILISGNFDTETTFQTSLASHVI